MAGKVQTDHAGMCAAYRDGLSQEEIASRFGVTKATVVRAAKRGIPAAERDQLRRARLLDGARKSTAIAQSRKIEAGSFIIARQGPVLEVSARGFSFLFDAQDEELLRKFAWNTTRDGRLIRQERRGGDTQNIYVYHDILGVRPSRAQVVDHINRDSTDNRRANLRVCTYSENAKNRGPRINHAQSTTSGATNDCA